MAVNATVFVLITWTTREHLTATGYSLEPSFCVTRAGTALASSSDPSSLASRAMRLVAERFLFVPTASPRATSWDASGMNACDAGIVRGPVEVSTIVGNS